MTDQVRLGAGFAEKLKVVPKPVLSGRIKLAALLASSEQEFHEHAKAVESDPLFLKLFRPENGSERVISIARPGRLKLSDRFLEYSDGLNASGDSLDVQSLLQRRKKAAAAIKKIGEENFVKYFLFNDSGAGPGEIARECGLRTPEAQEISGLIDELAAHGEFYAGQIAAPGKCLTYNKIAGIEKEGPGRFSIVYYAPRLARGKYSIDYEKMNALKARGVFSKGEAGRIDVLLRQLEAINVRKTIIHRVLENIIEFQKEYLETGETARLAPLSQKTVALRLEISPSLVNRALYSRSVSIPSGREVALNGFFPSKKDVVKDILKNIVFSEKIRLRDNAVRNLLMDKFGYRVSGHLVQIYRNELGIPPASRRAGGSAARGNAPSHK